VPCLTISSRRDLRDPATCHQQGSVCNYSRRRGLCFADVLRVLFPLPFLDCFQKLGHGLWLLRLPSQVGRGFARDDPRDFENLSGLCCATLVRYVHEDSAKKGPQKGAEGQYFYRITPCDISLPFCSLHHPPSTNGRYWQIRRGDAAGGGHGKHAIRPAMRFENRWRGGHFRAEKNIHYGGLRLDSPPKGPRTQASPSSLRARSHST